MYGIGRPGEVKKQKDIIPFERRDKINGFISRYMYKYFDNEIESRRISILLIPEENIELVLRNKRYISGGDEVIIYKNGIDIGFIEYFKKYDPGGEKIFDFFNMIEEEEILLNV